MELFVAVAMLVVVAAVATSIVVPVLRRWARRARRIHKIRVYYIRSYRFPPGVIDKALALSPAGASGEQIERGLRQFFLACAASTKLNAAMPSETVDHAWHTFITYTRDYAEFCRLAFGRFLHHVPETTMTANELADNRGVAVRVAWEAACGDEHLDPARTTTAPALFAADRDAGVTSARQYIATCAAAAVNLCTADQATMVCMEHRFPPPSSSRAGRVRRGLSGTAFLSSSDSSSGGTVGFTCGASSGCASSGGGCGGGGGCGSGS